MSKLRGSLFALTLLFAALAHADIDVAGVKFADHAKLGAATLALNGAGMRNKFFFKVYAMALYLPQPQRDAAAVLAMPGAEQIRIVTLRELTARQFADALVEGIRKNYPEAERAPLASRLAAFEAKMLALKTAAEGAVIEIDWLPGDGTRLVVNGEQQGEDIPGEDFYRALLKIWLGDKPAAQDLKEALLGHAH